MNKKNRAILFAMAIGDGYVKKLKSSSGYKNGGQIFITHSIKQKEYIQHKANFLRKIFGGSEVNLREFKNNGYPGVSISKGHKYFKFIRKNLYKDNKKVISRKVLNWLTPEAIAIWYMDDGNLSYKKRNGSIHGRELFINTHISKEENQVIIDYFKELWDIRFTQVKNRGYYRLRCGSKVANKFIELIKPYIIPSMLYKIDMKYKRKNI